MTNFEKILEAINGLFVEYRKTSDKTLAHKTLVHMHKRMVVDLFRLFNNIQDTVPEIGQLVLGLEDLRIIYKGVFLGDYFYEKCGFVANLGDDDPYRVTHWIAADTFNNMTVQEFETLFRKDGHSWV